MTFTKWTIALASTLLGTACGGHMVTDESGSEERQNTSFGSEGPGTLELQLVPVAGLQVSHFDYRVVAGSAAQVLAQGDLGKARTGSPEEYALELPSGSNYQLSITAKSDEPCDAITCSATYGPFGIAANVSTRVSLVVTCIDQSPGQILIEPAPCPP